MNENDIPKNPIAQGGYEDSSWECSQNHKNPDGGMDKLMKEEMAGKALQ